MFDMLKRTAAANPDGFTVRLPDGQPVLSGIVVAYLATQNSHDDHGLIRCIAHALDHDKVVGGWLDSYSGRFFWDSCRVFTDLEDAKAFGREQQQIAVFDLDELLEHRL